MVRGVTFDMDGTLHQVQGLDPAGCLHVGDSPSDDVTVPQSLGARPIVYDPLECVDCDCPRISRLMEVLSLL